MDADTLAAWYVLDGVKGFGPGKSRTLFEHAMRPQEVLDKPDALPIGGKTGEKLHHWLVRVTDDEREAALKAAERDLERAAELGVAILEYEDPRYPRNVFTSNLPSPFLFVRGDVSALQPRAVACVGSRAIREPYTSRQAEFAAYAAGEHDFSVVSGFATGADTLAHDAAVESDGRTVVVLPNGLDLVFPPENRDRWHRWLMRSGVAFVSDFRFGRRADALALRKRNKLIVALSAGVLIGQSAKQGGAMNAFRFAIEQRKPVATFAADDQDDSTGNAEIAEATKIPVTTFPRDSAALDVWEAWLRDLSP